MNTPGPPTELERQFLVASLPNPLPQPDRIVQGYLMTQPASVRVRRRSGAHTLTIKIGAGLSRTEIERAISGAEFEALWDVATELRIVKDRYRIPLFRRHQIAELDLYHDSLEGRRLVEVEFDSVAEAHAFEPPEWFGREVTEDVRYSNSSLARFGWPDEEAV